MLTSKGAHTYIRTVPEGEDNAIVFLLGIFVKELSSNLKGVFAKNERGYKLNAIKKLF